MPVAYAAADVVLSCSIEPEAYGRVTVKPIAMGRPIWNLSWCYLSFVWITLQDF